VKNSASRLAPLVFDETRGLFVARNGAVAGGSKTRPYKGADSRGLGSAKNSRRSERASVDRESLGRHENHRAQQWFGYARHRAAPRRITKTRRLESQAEATEDAPRQGNGGTGKEASEIDDVEAVSQVCRLNLEYGGALFFAIKFEVSASVERKVGLDSSPRQIHFIQYLRTILREQEGRRRITNIGQQTATLLTAHA